MSASFRVIMFMLALTAAPAFAGEEAVVSLFEGTEQEIQPQTEEEDGLFSFLGFKMPERSPDADAAKKGLPDTIEETIKLADEGNLQAQLLLGYSYLYGENGLKPDYDKAFEY